MILLELYERKQQVKRIILNNWLQITTLPQLSKDWLTWRETESSALRTCACSPLWTSRYPHQINNNWFFFQYDHVFIFKMFTFTSIQLTSLLLKMMTLKGTDEEKKMASSTILWPNTTFSIRPRTDQCLPLWESTDSNNWLTDVVETQLMWLWFELRTAFIRCSPFSGPNLIKIDYYLQVSLFYLNDYPLPCCCGH